jgi:hypothetical protein
VAVAQVTKIVQGWPKLWANFRALIGIFSKTVGPSLAIWANPVQFSLVRRVVAPNGVADLYNHACPDQN